jgi:hypothetical protein
LCVVAHLQRQTAIEHFPLYYINKSSQNTNMVNQASD